MVHEDDGNLDVSQLLFADDTGLAAVGREKL